MDLVSPQEVSAVAVLGLSRVVLAGLPRCVGCTRAVDEDCRTRVTQVLASRPKALAVGEAGAGQQRTVVWGTADAAASATVSAAR